MKRTKASVNVNVNKTYYHIVKLLNDTEIKNALKWAMKTYLKILLVASPLLMLCISYLVK